MSVHTIPPLVLIPESAPFNAEQRSWLSGYFAALLASPGGGATALAEGPALPAGPEFADNGSAPWHDPAMPLPERQTLAADKPLAPRLMAAMAQQDCGQCGYNCADYANALFLRKEERLNLCAPGGKDTFRALKKLADELTGAGAPAAAEAAPATAAPAAPTEPGRSRENPVEATFVGRRRLNATGSEKETWHVEIDLSASSLDYVVGDSLGVVPVNPPALVDAVIAQIGARPERLINGCTLRERLLHDYDLGPAPDALFQLLSYLTGGAQRAKARALAAGEDPDGDAAHLDVLAALHKLGGARPDAEAFVEALEPLQPRLYSISSSPKTVPGRVTLTVDAVRFHLTKRLRLGVCSTHFGERLPPGSPVKVYVQRAHGFALPADPATPIVMVGPGTGVAPFMAFLQERAAVAAPGKNWLFFGHQRRAMDFFYEPELTAWKEAGHLSRLTLAWSRDGAEKVYVQDRIRETGAELWRWLEEGAHFYICGDAKRMARDVEAALVDVVAQHGARSAEDAVTYVAGLKKASRYQADVY